MIRQGGKAQTNYRKSETLPTVTSQTKKQTQQLTLKWTFFRFRRVREVVVVEDRRRVKRVTNLNEGLQKIL